MDEHVFPTMAMFRLAAVSRCSVAAMKWIDWCSERDGDNRRALCCVSWVYFILAAVSFTGCLAAAIAWDKQQYQVVARWLLVPSIVIAALISLAWCRLTLAFRRAAREHAFQALYKQPWWKAQRAVAANMPAGHGVAAAMREVRNDLV